jgi:endo-1,4-beta-xylanase
MILQFDRPFPRRTFLKSVLAVQAGIELSRSSARHAGFQTDAGSLRLSAERHECLFGSAVKMSALGSDEAYADLVAHQCGILTPEGSLKWAMLRPTPDTFDFHDSDALMVFAKKNHQLVRGHTLVWDEGMPGWFASYTNARNAKSLLENHIRTVVGKYAGQIHSWDVVNEIIDAKQGDGLKVTPWLKYFGPSYVEQAFRLTRAADPHALLIYNEVRLEPDKSDCLPRQAAVLKLLTALKKNSVPMDGLGIQSHIWDHTPSASDWDKFRRFLSEVRQLGLSILVTELDFRVDRAQHPGTDVQALLADRCYKYLSFMRKEGGVKTILTWGLASKYSWLKKVSPGQLIGLPYDDSLRHTATWDAIAHALSFT